MNKLAANSMKKCWLVFVMAMGFTVIGHADDACNMDTHFGPVSFENEQPVAALRKILAGTGISLVESGEFDAGTISAQNVSGTVGAVVQRLAEGTGLQYTCHNGVMRVSQKSHVPSTSIVPDKPLAAVGSSSLPEMHAPNAVSMTLHKGDSLKAQLTAFSSGNQYQVSWTGDDLFAKQDAVFTGGNFEDVVNRFLQAAKITGYISNDEGRVLNVFVQ